MIVPARSRPTGLGFLALGSNVFNCILKYNLQTFVHVFLLHHVFLPGEVVARFQTLSALSLSRGFVATLVNWSRLPSVVRVRGSVRAPTFRLSERAPSTERWCAFHHASL